MIYLIIAAVLFLAFLFWLFIFKVCPAIDEMTEEEQENYLDIVTQNKDCELY